MSAPMLRQESSREWWYWRCVHCGKVDSYPAPPAGPWAPACRYGHYDKPMERVEVVAIGDLLTDEAIDRAAAAWWGHDGSDKEVEREAMRSAIRAAVGAR